MALKFEYNKEERTATVCGVDDKSCEKIIIPATVEYYKKDYKVTSIGKEAFKGCESLKEVTIPDSVTSIGDYVFLRCSSLKAFYGRFASADNRCLIVNGVLNSFAPVGLTKYTILDSVTSIENGAFCDCTSLKEVTIPDSVTSIEEAAFYHCTSLKAFYGKFTSSDNRCLIVDGVLNSFAPAGLTKYTIPNSVTLIGSYAFYGCSSLTSITIPNSVTSIGYGAFYGCTSLKEVTIPDSVTSIGNSAFKYCTLLTSVTIPNSVTSIGSGTFHWCTSLKEVSIPNSVTKIGWNAFYGCSSLTSITIPDSVKTIDRFAFWHIPNLKVNICNDKDCVIAKDAFESTAKINKIGFFKRLFGEK